VKLLLFDIDGTLINGSRAGRTAMGCALEDMFATKGALDAYPMGGKTDMCIVTDLLVEAGVPTSEIEEKLPVFFELMAEYARHIYPDWGIRACVGIESLLAALGDTEDVLLGLLTGNAEATAPLKLAAAGIDPGQFLVGAYGSEHLDRNALPALAMRRARELTGEMITGDNVVIIGDTPADVACARAGKATAVAVATGWHSVDSLLDHRPDHIFTDFGDTLEALNVLLA
jgi:phosphoglycolate phosphatase-like HAD superfamily hydrolase